MTATVSLTTPPRPIPDAGAPPTPVAWEAAFGAALPYAEFLGRHATPDQRDRWAAVHARVALSPAQQTLLGGFVRRMPVLVLAGAWCGDCVNQCPIFDHFQRAAPAAIDVRFLDRDALPDIAAHLRVCGGQRVPVAAFFSEDFAPILFYGDRTLAAYRAAAAQCGTACPSGAVAPPADALAAAAGDWLDEFERVHHILRLSARLREKHGD